MNLQEFSFRVRALETKLYKTAVCILKNDQDAADCVQEALLSAWKSLPRLKNEAYFDTWLTRILINECKMLIRSGRNRQAEALNDSICAPERTVTDVERALDALEEKYRLPIVLFHINGYNAEETARILKKPVGTIKTQLSRGRKKLKALLESEVEQ